MFTQTFDKPSLQAFRKEMEADLAALNKKYGMTFALGSCKFSAETAEFKLTVSLPAQDGTAETAAAKEFKRYAKANLLGSLQESDLGRSFRTTEGRVYTIVGAKMSARKYPILATSALDGRTYKFSELSVESALKRP